MTRRPAVIAAIAASTLVALGTGLTPAGGEPARSRPQGPAKVAFASDFPKLIDHEWRFPLGGFGGIRRGAPLRHVPVIFVHGNNVDAADWYPVRDDFRKAGWTDQELWALSYNGLGSNAGTAITTPNPERDAEHREMGWDGQVRITNNEVNVADLYDFIEAVRAYTGSPRFVLITHSLGVTLARRTLKVHPELRGDLVAFVGIAGANHGTSLCPPGSEGNVVSCDEIAAGTKWLADLNGPDGSDETYGPARWMTVYDGSGAGDPAFAGPAYAASPALKGADNRTFPGTYHNDLRLAPAIVEVYRGFVADAEAGAAGATAPAAGAPAVPAAPLPAGPEVLAAPSPPSPAAAPGAGAAPGALDVGAAPAPSPDAVTPAPVPAASSSGGPTAPASSDPAVVAATGGGRRLGGPRSGAMVWSSFAGFVAGAAVLAADQLRRRRLPV